MRGVRLIVCAVWAVAFSCMLLRVDAVLAQGAGEQDVELRIEQFGVGNASRAGSWAGIQVRARDLDIGTRSVVLRVTIRDPDGDLAHYDREVVLNAAESTGLRGQLFWLYAPLPSDLAGGGGDPVLISVHEAEEAPDASPTGFTAGRLLGEYAYTPTRVESRYSGMLGVIGAHDFGLGGYAEAGDATGSYPARAHELTRVVTGIDTSLLPDRWQGLAAYDVLVWGGIGDRHDPSSLDLEHARAIEQWVRRGGHLVVALPATGQTWTNPQSNRLIDIFPEVAGAPVRHEGVDMESWKYGLTSTANAIMPSSAVVHELRAAPDAAVGASVEVLRSPEGWCIALRRQVGAGAVTVLGVDVSSSGFRRAGALEADVFWHRVLGRRGKIMTREQVQRDQGLATGIGSRGQSAAVLDENLASAIAKGGKSLRGLLFAIVIFGAYWVVAGPGGFALLSKFGYRRHAWLGFVAATAVCTAIAWTGAIALRPARVESTHATVLIATYGQETALARVWASVLVPRYGEARLTIGDGGEGSAELGSDLLGPWTPASTPGARTVGSFPDNRGYIVDAEEPSELRVPTRSTVKQVVGSWAGAVPEAMIQPVARTPGDPERLTVRNSTEHGGQYVSGVLAHNFEGALRDVDIFTVTQQDAIRSMGRAALSDLLVSSANVRAQSISEWPAGVALSLDDVFRLAEGETVQRLSGEDALKGMIPGMSATGLGADVSIARGLRMSLLYSALPPWDASPRSRASKLVRRAETHGLDLGRWFTQPCVIVLAEYEDTGDVDPLVPVRVDGRVARSDGLVQIAWIYPLDSAPPRWLAHTTNESNESSGANP